VAPVEPLKGSAPVTPLAPAGAHGGDGAVVAASLGIDPDAVLDLSQSLNPVAPDPVPVVARHLGAIRRYPDPRPAHRSLAATMGIDPDRLLLTNGGAEAISLVAAELGGRVVEPEFALHPRGSGAVWRSNPHNPSGLLAAAADIADVWDEAFFPLATGRWTRGDAAAAVGSLTKLLACPGLRLGYVLADPDLVDRCRRRQPAWSVNSLALAVLPELLDAVDLSAWSTSVSTLRRQLVDELQRHGLGTRPSDAPWVLVERGDLRNILAPYGIVVRDCSSFGMPEVSRVAVPSADGLGRLSSVLDRADLDPLTPPPPPPARRATTGAATDSREERG
jgi:histidinol-phosphate/aromatic aminotransferase/cobyric acid decarboxylase-like protein